MTSFATLLDSLVIDGPLPQNDVSMPLGTAWLAGRRRGLDLSAHGYEEQEFLVSGDADCWTWDHNLLPLALDPQPFTTRVLVRTPVDPKRFSGGVQLEPHHPDGDRAMSWAMIAPWIVRGGHAHVGITHDPASLPGLSSWDPERYGSLSVADGSQRWDIVALIAAAVASGRMPAFADLNVRRAVLSGWSMTGTFCRTFLGEGFHDRCALNGKAVIDGYVICISSGGAGRAGYAPLRPGTQLPAQDPRRTIGAHGVPIVELLSEAESETHRAVLRPDADAPEDRYRLYQVAGTGHITTHLNALSTNRAQMRMRGFEAPPREINEQPSDARMDLIAQAVFDAVDRWIADGTVPARAGRFNYEDPAAAGPRGQMPESLPLRRDGDGNVVGGIRTPWIEVPAATYVPHSTPRPGRCIPSPQAPYSDPALLADLIAHMRPFSAAELTRRYGSRDRYLEQFARAARSLHHQRWLLREDLAELLSAWTESCGW